MIQPIEVNPRHETALAVPFTGGVENAWAIADWLKAAVAGTPSEGSLQLYYRESLDGPSSFSFYLGGDSHEVEMGDYIIKEDDLFSVCRGQDYGLRYVPAGLL